MQPETAQTREEKRARLTRRALLAGGLAAPAVLLATPVPAASGELVRDVSSYHQALAALVGQHRFALVDIRADWCAVCHRIEREILSHPTVRLNLEHVPLLKVDVSAMDEANRQLLAHLRASGPPTFFVVDAATGAEYDQTRSLGSFSRRNLIRRLAPFSGI